MGYDLIIVARGHPDETPSTRYRVSAFLPFLAQAGISHRVVLPPRRRLVHFYLWPVFYARVLVHGLRARTILVQKDIFFLPLWRLLKRAGKRIVYDFDDAIHTGDARHVYYVGSRRNPAEIVARMIALADHVMVANRHLLAFAQPYNANTEILPMAVDLDLFPTRVRQLREPVTIGWIGSPFTSPYLAALQPALAVIAARHGACVRIRIITSGAVSLESVPIEHQAWSRETEVAQISNFDIGLVPLPTDDFAAGKSSYKLLQFMAAGVPAVASHVGFNAEIVRHGVNGFLAASEQEWIDAIETLIRNPDLRWQVGCAARATAEAEFALRLVAARWVAIAGASASPQLQSGTQELRPPNLSS